MSRSLRGLSSQQKTEQVIPIKNDKSIRIRDGLILLSQLICLAVSGCDGNSFDTPSKKKSPSANAQTGNASQIEHHVEQAPAADRAPSEILLYRRQRPPKYPVQAVRERMQGKVILKVLVGLDGMPEEIEVTKSSGSQELDGAAIAAVNTWIFNVGMKNGGAIRGYVMVPIEFNLNQ